MSGPAPRGIVGPGAEYQGDLVVDGPVVVHGVFEGRLETDDLLEVGVDAQVSGEIDVAQALVFGRVTGLLRVRERCTLMPGCILEGQLITPWLDVRLGASIRGELLVAGAGKRRRG